MHPRRCERRGWRGAPHVWAACRFPTRQPRAARLVDCGTRGRVMEGKVFEEVGSVLLMRLPPQLPQLSCDSLLSCGVRRTRCCRALSGALAAVCGVRRTRCCLWCQAHSLLSCTVRRTRCCGVRPTRCCRVVSGALAAVVHCQAHSARTLRPSAGGAPTTHGAPRQTQPDLARGREVRGADRWRDRCS